MKCLFILFIINVYCHGALVAYVVIEKKEELTWSFCPMCLTSKVHANKFSCEQNVLSVLSRGHSDHLSTQGSGGLHRWWRPAAMLHRTWDQPVRFHSGLAENWQERARLCLPRSARYTTDGEVRWPDESGPLGSPEGEPVTAHPLCGPLRLWPLQELHPTAWMWLYSSSQSRWEHCVQTHNSEGGDEKEQMYGNVLFVLLSTVNGTIEVVSTASPSTRTPDQDLAGKHCPLSSPSATFDQTTLDLRIISSLDAAELSGGSLAAIIIVTVIVVGVLGFGEFSTSFCCLSEKSYTFLPTPLRSHFSQNYIESTF